MGRERILTVLSGAVLAFAVSFGCAGCVMSAYFYPGMLPGGLTPTCSLTAVGLWCGALGLLMAVLGAGRKGWLLWAALLPLGLILWLQGSLILSVEVLCRLLSSTLDRPYHLGILTWTRRPGTDVTMALCALVTVPALVTAWTVTRPAQAMWAVLAALLPMSLCGLVVDRVPDSGWLMLLMLGLLILLLTGAVRRQNRQQGNILGLIVAVPCALAVLLLFLLVPRQGYDKAELAYRLQQTIEGWFTPHTVITVPETLPEPEQPVPVLREQVDLAHLSVQNDRPWVVMTVHAQKPGNYYLRGQVFDVYTGTGWAIHAGRPELPWLPDHALEHWGTVQIRTEQPEPVCYVPYYCQQLTDRERKNPHGLLEYEYVCRQLPENPHGNLLGGKKGLELLTELPRETRLWAEQLLRSLPDRDPESIREFVSEAAEYDRRPSRMPAQQQDFARWFLEEGERGYCVHFASSAVVLLRAAGYPARYVTGYTVRAGTDQTVQVQARQAHAWAEYWTPEAGWQILEATPGTHAPDEPVTEPTQPTETTQATEPSGETESTTVTTSPTEATQTLPTEAEQTHRPAQAPALRRVLLWAAGILAVIGAAVLQRVLRLRARTRARKRGKPNEQALSAWNQLLQLARYSGTPVEQEVLELAQKAKFSSHTLTNEELHRFDRERYRLLACLRKQSLPRRFYYRWILCLY